MSRARRLILSVGIILTLGLAIWGMVTVLAGHDVRARIENMEAQRKFAETGEGLVEYAVTGEGPPLLVIHGAGGGFDQGQLFAEAFIGEGYRRIAPSRFGYLGSPLPDNASTSAQADAFAALMDDLGLDRVHILAVSGGVPPALQLASRHPERVSGLVLLSPAPFTPHGAPDGERPIPAWVYEALFGSDTVYWTLSKLAPSRLREAFDARAELLVGLSNEERHRVDRIVESFLPASRRIEGIGNEVAAIAPDARYALEDIAAPALIVHARDDRINPFAIGVDLSQRIENAQFLEIERGGHLLLGHHEEIRGRVRTFLDGISTPE
ncbi:MAG: alpha/beta hydrolase [Parvibaculum sp.]|uniref:alpha/beta fold hydrolase n=1 Tax=Alphaproteobacteria TaxID=28211 RepID=UPI001B144D29|nr:MULTISPECIES: alpha/beta hydrolase [Alphaproteobacteria]MBO6635744.1 alpha/beta hydrolase [Parvibaculum sp.]